MLVIEEFLTMLSKQSKGILMFILCVFALMSFINWLAKLFSWGRYKQPEIKSKGYGNLIYMVTQFFANLINDFKHFLALVIVLIFAGLIIFSMAATDLFYQKMEALKLVIASLGGIMGTVIGYYFGESAARTNSAITGNGEAAQQSDSLEGKESIQEDVYTTMQPAPDPGIDLKE